MVPARKGPEEPPSPDFAAVRMDDVEIAAPLSTLPAMSPDDETVFAGSMCLVRLHGTPLGMVDLELPSGGLPAEDLAVRIEAELKAEIAEHLRRDGLDPRPLTPLDSPRTIRRPARETGLAFWSARPMP